MCCENQRFRIKNRHTTRNKYRPTKAKDIKKIKKIYDEIKRNEQKHSKEIKMLKQSLSITPVVGFHVFLSKIF